MDILSKIQFELNAPKNQRNNFGKYNYRSCEDILEGLKVLIAKYNVSVIVSDEIMIVGDRFYIKATAKLMYEGQNIGSATGLAREPKDQKGMNEAQITGSASSYARKYALNGLFAIDDNKDADTDEHQNNANNRPIQKKEKTIPVNPKMKVTEITHNIVKSYIKSGIMPENKSKELAGKLNNKQALANQNLVDELIKVYGSLNA